MSACGESASLPVTHSSIQTEHATDPVEYETASESADPENATFSQAPSLAQKSAEDVKEDHGDLYQNFIDAWVTSNPYGMHTDKQKRIATSVHDVAKCLAYRIVSRLSNESVRSLIDNPNDLSVLSDDERKVYVTHLYACLDAQLLDTTTSSMY
ncbi:MAG: hypothetical protein J6M18_04090 [Actinomycetaceae bacterium]|nr:hypothetical protein [Actinomycetaceae bacterium]